MEKHYPEIQITKSVFATITQNKTGDLANVYSPLHNLVDPGLGLTEFTTKNLKFDKNTPVDMLITDEYDGSTNIILNDDKNAPKLINNRFSVQENQTFSIPEHFGNTVTNLYDDSAFDNNSGLFKLYNRIPKLTFKGLRSGGELKCGSYVFYFKFSDADGNLSNIVQHSSIVQVPVGELNSYKLRMGMEDEVANKIVQFSLEDLDAGFDYIRVFYERFSTGNAQAGTESFYMINQNYPIINGKCDIDITGGEDILQIALSDITTQYADISTAKTQAIVSNTLFLGNVSSYVQDYQKLQELAWRIYITQEEKNPLENINHRYDGNVGETYYEPKSVYNYTGYWPDEFYRFGIVFIFNNNQLSPAYNIQGYDLEKKKNIKDLRGILWNRNYNKYEFFDYEPENYIFNESIFSNSKGVCHLAPKEFNDSITSIQFHLDGLTGGTFDKNRLKELFKELNIKGFFFVRQKRIPTILAQGVVIGVTKEKNGSLPILKWGSKYISKSFLSSNRMLSPYGSDILTEEAENKGLLVPDAELQEATYNQIFTGQEFALVPQGCLDFERNDDWFVYKNVSSKGTEYHKSKLTAVPKDITLLTDGENYFSTLAGDSHSVSNIKDIVHDWNNTPPQDLTRSTSIVRGQWGYFVGSSYSGFDYGTLVNIKKKEFAEDYDSQIKLEFQGRFSDYSYYSPISPRFNWDQMEEEMTCYQGDCFFSIFTHKMMNNFADPELPTNTRIIDPKCWAKNYAVRATAYIDMAGKHFNASSADHGWWLNSNDYKKPSDPKAFTFHNEAADVFDIDLAIYDMKTDSSYDMGTKEEKEVEEEYKSNKGLTPTNYSPMTSPLNYSTDVIVGQTRQALTDWEILEQGQKIQKIQTFLPFSPAFFLQIAFLNKNKGYVNEEKAFKQLRRSQSNDSGGLLSMWLTGKSFRHSYVTRGLSKINRSDVNAVSYAQWITFPVYSSLNLAYRDIDFSQVTEEAQFNRKRSFYPLAEMDSKIHLQESNVTNYAVKKSIYANQVSAYRVVPYIKQEYFNRIYWSKPNVAQTFINSYRMVFDTQYQEYNKEWGSIVKILPYSGGLFVVFEHGMGLLPINLTPQTTQEASPYLASKSVLSSIIEPISKDYGSMWKDSVISTPYGVVYGVDTVAKKIWQYFGGKLNFISDQKVNKFLNDFINLSEYDKTEYIGHINVKTHYNEFKHDVIFTLVRDKVETWDITEDHVNQLVEIYKKENLSFSQDYSFDKSNLILTIDNEQVQYVIKNGYFYQNDLNTGVKVNPLTWTKGTVWSLCYNEAMGKFVTFYDWYPVFSENIDNAFFSFDQEQLDSVYQNEQDSGIKIIKNNPFGQNYSYTINKNIIDKTFIDKAIVFPFSGMGDYQLHFNTGVGLQYLCFYTKSTTKVTPINSDEYWKLSSKETAGAMSSEYTFYVIKCTSGFIDLKLEESTKSFELIDLKIISADYLNKNNYSISDINLGTLSLYGFRNSVTNSMKLWKHGMAGLYDNQGIIKPTNWYGKQHEFNFEFVVSDTPNYQKIFNNLKIISNKAEPGKFEYEITGEGYGWFDYKPIVLWINKQAQKSEDLDYWYAYVLNKKDPDEIKKEYPDFPEFYREGDYSSSRNIVKLPYLKLKFTDKEGTPEKPAYEWNGGTTYWTHLKPDTVHNYDFSFNCNEPCLVEDYRLNEQKIRTESLGNNIKKWGRVRGNMEYQEDLWNVEIRPIQLTWCHLVDGELKFVKKTETRHRDKYIKIKIRYSGKDLALISSVITFFEISMA